MGWLLVPWGRPCSSLCHSTSALRDRYAVPAVPSLGGARGAGADAKAMGFCSIVKPEGLVDLMSQPLLSWGSHVPSWGACCSVVALACRYPSLHFPRVKTSGLKQPGCSLGTQPRPWWPKPSVTSRSPLGFTSELQSWRRTSAPRSGFFGKVSRGARRGGHARLLRTGSRPAAPAPRRGASPRLRSGAAG